MAINPIIKYPFNFCFKCNAATIELYSWQGYPLKYQKMINEYMTKGTIQDIKYSIYEMKCPRCNSKYQILWEDGFPRPAGELYVDYFNKKIKSDSKKFAEENLVIDNIYKEKLKGDNTDEIS